VEPHNLSDPHVGEYFATHDYEIANDKAAAGQASSFLRTLILIVMAVGVIITLLALGLMLLSINLLIQKNHAKIENLSLLGYSTEAIARPYQWLVVILNVGILLLSLVLVNYFRGQYTASFNTSIHIDEDNLAWNYILWGVYIVVALSVINIGWIYMKVREIRR
jgi:cell division protein FtsX